MKISLVTALVSFIFNLEILVLEVNYNVSI